MHLAYRALNQRRNQGVLTELRQVRLVCLDPRGMEYEKPRYNPDSSVKLDTLRIQGVAVDPNGFPHRPECDDENYDPMVGSLLATVGDMQPQLEK